MDSIQHLLTSDFVASLLSIHPNDIGSNPSFEPPSSWQSWWEWVAQGVKSQGDNRSQWLQLADCFNMNWCEQHTHNNIPQVVCNLIKELQSLQLPRKPVKINEDLLRKVILDDRGMSPKKIHEVSRMVIYISNLLNELQLDPKRVRIVDIGAGQGYLTRTLKLYLGTTHVLALDSDQWQTQSSKIWEERVARHARAFGNDPPSVPIAHRTIHITPNTLIPAIDDWVSETSTNSDHGDPDPVLLIALHACGSLTPDILRACITSLHRHNQGWRTVGAVVVGCCYNLIKPADFPLSNTLKMLSTPSSRLSPLQLPSSAYNLATQIPSQWLMSPKAAVSVSLSIRKVVWRALLGGKLVRRSALGEAPRKFLEFEDNSPATTFASWATKKLTAPPSRRLDIPLFRTGSESNSGVRIGTNPTMRLLGRLPDSAYSTWEAFLHAAGQKLGVDLSDAPTQDHDLLLERRLEVLHVLRCLIGPLVESLIILDRLEWLKEELATVQQVSSRETSGSGHKLAVDTPEKQGGGTQTKMINMFDQATGSGRNIAIIVVPTPPISVL
ncbi:hypothetical protein AMATHDRAFT_170291 [Amanita thiersii Skay4041]|uniref:Methyltransferase domain-containing protein n=1 Tax=Amanita thiersii Skay4041 TaxID=703135 RepID=A0A2A9NWP6_9AGAR|nr:hypothetical protein AMATHDRAFT_170291 [Amanita thiersii Skay4041]